MQTYEGGCHCKAVRYEVELDLSQPAIECNCSHCQIKGFILLFTTADQFELLQGGEKLMSYRFNKHLIDHAFCSGCGVQAFGRGADKEGNPTVAVNLRTIDNIDLSTLNRMPYDGRSA